MLNDKQTLFSFYPGDVVRENEMQKKKDIWVLISYAVYIGQFWTVSILG